MSMKANELTSKDLMIEDWLQDSFGNIGQVYRLDPGRVHLRLLQERPQDEEYIVHDIEPIPLTPEILEKNGFTLENKVKHPARYIYNISYSNSVIVDFDCYNNGRGAMKCILAGVGLVSNSFIRIYGKDIYVHQLQHALKACGISKEIVV